MLKSPFRGGREGTPLQLFLEQRWLLLKGIKLQCCIPHNTSALATVKSKFTNLELINTECEV